MSYDHKFIDSKWQKKWEDAKIFEVKRDPNKKKFYCLDMFPYPSGSGLHVGHLASYTPTEIVARYKKACGYNVLHPFGYDAFGLPAEQYAIQTGIHPEVITLDSINNFRRQLKSFGYSFDWSREISTCSPDYYKWTQFIFVKLFENKLAYQKEVPVNWCPELKTVLANEEVVDGKSERGGHPVIRIPMKQWMLKITEYAERLIQGFNSIDWPKRTKEGQLNWIGRSEGAEINFNIKDSDAKLKVFTTRADTLFGNTFMVLAPEHPLVIEITNEDCKEKVEKYKLETSKKSDLERKSSVEKSGVFTGSYVIHPITSENIPIWISDYILMDYGTGAIMAVPGHDTRDFEFAKKFNLEIKRVIQSEEPLPFEGDGKLVNSKFINNLNKDQAINKMINYLEEKNIGKRKVQYRLRDWLFSRQRYWGEPFPIVSYEYEKYEEDQEDQEEYEEYKEKYKEDIKNGKGTIDRKKIINKAVSIEELPVVLPDVPQYEPSDKGEPPLARNEQWVEYVDPKTRKKGKRDCNTMPGYAGSSWYFLRYTDPHNDNLLASLDEQRYWMPVDLYVGGPEHTVGHLLYSRFWQKFLYDQGLATCDEPFLKLAHQGMILGHDGEKMSKSRGNTLNPDKIRDQYGADAVRMYICFMGPMDRDKPWSEKGIEGVRRFLERLWRFCFDENGNCILNDDVLPKDIESLLNKTIKKVGDDIENLSFNTAVSSMMILVNDLYKTNIHSKKVIEPLCKILMPFAPHLAEEIWQRIGHNNLISTESWPSYDENLVRDDVVIIGVQVNGKMRGTIEILQKSSQDEALEKAYQIKSVENAIGGKKVLKIIYRPGKILNIICK